MLGALACQAFLLACLAPARGTSLPTVTGVLQMSRRSVTRAYARMCSEMLQLWPEMIAVQFDFFGECFFHDFSLLSVEYLLIGVSIGAVFRFACDAKCSVEPDI